MRPPYDPAHVERVTFGARRDENGDRDGTNNDTVVAHCSCGWSGTEHALRLVGAACRLAADLNDHRETYVGQVAS